MKDKKDTQTVDFFAPRPVGRPRLHVSSADKQKAYRLRKKNRILKGDV